MALRKRTISISIVSIQRKATNEKLNGKSRTRSLRKQSTFIFYFGACVVSVAMVQSKISSVDSMGCTPGSHAWTYADSTVHGHKWTNATHGTGGGYGLLNQRKKIAAEQ
jgi:hypothetical protein